MSPRGEGSPSTSADASKVLLGNVVTLDGAGRSATAIRVCRDRIEQVGDTSLVEPGDAVLDFGSRTLLPGFVDPHVHFEITARAERAMVDCRAPRCASISDVLDTLSDHVGQAREGWVVGQGNLFLDQKLAEGRLPSMAELDSVSSRLAIALRAGGHRTVLNSRAFELADVVSLAGANGMMGRAVVEVDETGRPTGVVGEIDKALPFPSLDDEELVGALRDGGRNLFTRYGVTTIAEISETPAGLHALDGLVKRGEFAPRCYVYLWCPGTIELSRVNAWRDMIEITSPQSLLQVHGLKVFADGGYSSRNAATIQTYRSEFALRRGSRGGINLNSRQIGNAARVAAATGLQLAVHANGERAQAMVCSALAAIGVEAILPPRIEHAGNVVSRGSTTTAWRDAKAVPVANAPFLYSFGEYLPQYLGTELVSARFPFRDLLDDGWHLSSASDVHLGAEQSQSNPLFGVWCCVKRQGFSGQSVASEQAVSIEEALRMHTIYPAEALGAGTEIGSLEKGKFSDIVVLDRDPCAVERLDDLLDVQVDFVMRGGEIVHERTDVNVTSSNGVRR